MLATAPGTATAQGTIIGTLQYMAPEQVQGQPADARTDIFAPGRAALRDGDGPAGFRSDDAGESHREDPRDRTARRLVARPARAARPRPRRPELSGESACRSVADGSRREAAAPMDSGAGLAHSASAGGNILGSARRGGSGASRGQRPARSSQRCCWSCSETVSAGAPDAFRSRRCHPTCG